LNGGNWTDVENDEAAEDFYNFPQLPKECFSQLWELTTIHGARKGIAVSSHLRRKEVSNEEEPESFEEYQELLSLPIHDLQVQVQRLEKASDSYKELEAQGILPPWPGPGYLFRTVCAPAHRSDTDRNAYKTPMIYLLDEDTCNPLNCTDVFRRIAATFCYNCPSTNGGISSCCHIAFFVMVLSATYALDTSYNKAVKIVSIKNPHIFLHPPETMSSARAVQIPKNVKRTSSEKRENDPLFKPDNFLYLDETEEYDEEDDMGIDGLEECRQEECGQEEDVQEEDVQEEDVQEEDGEVEDGEVEDVGVQQEDEANNLEIHSTCSTISTAPSLYGRGVGNVQKFVRKANQKDPQHALPEVNVERRQGKYVYLTIVKVK
jgi:hypothetical protein